MAAFLPAIGIPVSFAKPIGILRPNPVGFLKPTGITYITDGLIKPTWKVQTVREKAESGSDHAKN